MKKRTVALVLALIMAAGLVPAAAAATFPDVASSHWAASYIDAMTERGLYEGYPDGMFRPQELLTTSQAIALCVRMCGFDETASAAAVKDYETRVYAATGGQSGWAQENFAVAAAAGIATPDELRDLSLMGKLENALTREEFTKYLVRALGLEVPTGTLVFAFGDAADIAAEYRPYVSALSNIGVIQGDTKGNFNPKESIKREDSATMFSRAVDYMDSNALLLELPGYEDYDVRVGTVQSYANGILTIDNLTGGSTGISLPAGTTVYRNNRAADGTALTVGSFVRVCSRNGAVFAVRVETGRIQRYTGTLVSFDSKTGTVKINTGTRTYECTADSATLFAAGSVTGGAEVYDSESNYTSVTAIVDPRGRLAVVSFEGGNRYESVFLTGIDRTEGTIDVETPSGKPSTLKLAENVEYILPNGSTVFTGTYIDRRCDIRVDNATGEVISIEPDMSAEYVRGGFVRVSGTTTMTVTIENVPRGGTTSCRLADAPAVTVNGARARLTDIKEGMFVTMRRVASTTASVVTVDAIDAYDAGSVRDCVLDEITYGKTVTMSVTYTGGEKGVISFEADKAPRIERNKRVTYVDRLRVGDKLTVTTEYWRVTLIEVDPLESNLSGTIEGISITSAGTSVTVKDDAGATATYPLAPTAEILRDGKTVAITTIQGMHAALTLSAGEIVAIEVSAAESIQGSFSGRILVVNSTTRELLVERTDTGAQERVYVDYNTTILTGTGSSSSFGSLEPETRANIYYEIVDGVMNATIIIIGG